METWTNYFLCWFCRLCFTYMFLSEPYLGSFPEVQSLTLPSGSCSVLPAVIVLRGPRTSLPRSDPVWPLACCHSDILSLLSGQPTPDSFPAPLQLPWFQPHSGHHHLKTLAQNLWWFQWLTFTCLFLFKHYGEFQRDANNKVDLQVPITQLWLTLNSCPISLRWDNCEVSPDLSLHLYIFQFTLYTRHYSESW